MCGVYIIRNSLRYIISIKDAVYHQGIRLVYHHAFACIEATQVFAYGENTRALRLVCKHPDLRAG